MKLKYMIVGFIAGVFAATAITAGASTMYEKLTAVARPDYTIVVDGSTAKLNNAPVTINGNSYLPVREVATLLDTDVSFNSGIIELTTKQESEGDSKVNITKNEIEPTDINEPAEPVLPTREKISDLDESVWLNILNQRETANSEYGLVITGDALGNMVVTGNDISFTINSDDYNETGEYSIIVNDVKVAIKVLSKIKFFNVPDLIAAGMID